MAYKAEAPRPIEVLVCTLCGQPWADHITVAEAEAYAEIDNDDLDADTMWSIEVTADDIHQGICIELLKRANRGPKGPQGLS